MRLLLFLLIAIQSMQSYAACMYYSVQQPFMLGTEAFPSGTIIKLCTDNTVTIGGNEYVSGDPVFYQNGSMKYAFMTDFMGDAEFIITLNNKNKTANAILRMQYDHSEMVKLYMKEISTKDIEAAEGRVRAQQIAQLENLRIQRQKEREIKEKNLSIIDNLLEENNIDSADVVYNKFFLENQQSDDVLERKKIIHESFQSKYTERTELNARQSELLFDKIIEDTKRRYEYNMNLYGYKPSDIFNTRDSTFKVEVFSNRYLIRNFILDKNTKEPISFNGDIQLELIKTVSNHKIYLTGITQFKVSRSVDSAIETSSLSLGVHKKIYKKLSNTKRYNYRTGLRGDSKNTKFILDVANSGYESLSIKNGTIKISKRCKKKEVEVTYKQIYYNKTDLILKSSNKSINLGKVETSRAEINRFSPLTNSSSFNDRKKQRKRETASVITVLTILFGPYIVFVVL